MRKLLSCLTAAALGSSLTFAAGFSASAQITRFQSAFSVADNDDLLIVVRGGGGGGGGGGRGGGGDRGGSDRGGGRDFGGGVHINERGGASVSDHSRKDVDQSSSRSRERAQAEKADRHRDRKRLKRIARERDSDGFGSDDRAEVICVKRGRSYVVIGPDGIARPCP